MKKIFLSILAIAGLMTATSCQKELVPATRGGEVEFSITVGVPGGITTYASEDGGATNVLRDTYDQRFILEVYDGDNCAYREVKTVEIGKKVSFDMRLLAKVYKFALWADFVENGTDNDNLYDTESGLGSVRIKSDRAAGKEEADAYCYSEDVDLSEGSLSRSFTLRRPFGKIRLVSTDAAVNGTGDYVPESSAVTYGTEIMVPAGYDVLTGEASDEKVAAGSYAFEPYKETVTVGGEDKGELYILGVDYILASESSTYVSFDVQVDGNGTKSVTNIPVSANKLTTVIGNFYTNEGGIDVIVDDEFDGDETGLSMWDGSRANPVIDDAQKSVTISSAAQVAGFADLVNSGNTYKGYTVTLMTDIDLNSIEWTPVGEGVRNGSDPSGNSFKGVFDGNGKTVSNLSIQQDPENPDQAIGLFGIVDGGTVKNLKFENVQVNVPSSEMAAAAVGMLTGGGTVSGIEVKSGSVSATRGNGAVVGRMTKSGVIEDCANYATVSGTGANVGGIVGAAYYTTEEGSTMTIEDCHNFGKVSGTAGVVGGIAGLSAADVVNCTNEADITGSGADVAGIVAEQQNAGSITGCVNKGNITNNAASYGTGGIVGWIRYNGATTAYPFKEVIVVSGNTNYGSIQGGNDAGGIVGTAYNLGIIKENYNYAPALSAKTFAAGIVGNAQFTETAVGMTESNMVSVTGNFTATSLDEIEAPCKDLFVYINEKDAVTEENNTLLITTADRFKSFATAVNGGKTFSGINVALSADIDLNNDAWTPIGTSSNPFQGTFDGNGHIVSNLNISGLDKSVVAGLFGRLNGTVRNLTIDGASVKHVSDGSGGIGIVAGSIFTTGLIEEVTVSNAKVSGNRWTGGIAGYVYGSVKNCSVSDIELTVTPDELTGKFDNGDKVGGIIGFSANDNGGEITGNKAENITISAYRDMGGIAGAANASALSGNSVSDIKLTVDQKTGWYGDEDPNAGYILGRNLGGTLSDDNTQSGENTMSKVYLISEGSGRIKDNQITFAPESNSTYYVKAGTYAGIQVFTNDTYNVSLIAEDGVTIDGNVTFGTHSNRTRNIPEYIRISGFTVNGELRMMACGKAEATGNTVAQLTVKTFGLTDDPSYTSEIVIDGNTIDGSMATTPQGYALYIVPNVTGYSLSVKGNTFRNVQSHCFTIQGNGDGAAKTTVGEYDIKDNKFESWGLGGKENRGAVKVWADTEMAPADMTGGSVSSLSEKAKTFVKHILGNNNTFPSTLESNCCFFEFYGLAFNEL